MMIGQAPSRAYRYIVMLGEQGVGYTKGTNMLINQIPYKLTFAFLCSNSLVLFLYNDL